MKKLTVVIPALNEEMGIGAVIEEIPTKKLNRLGYTVEVLVIDNGSTDRTGIIARQNGATVIVQPIRGYGSAYQAGFANATGDIIATGDADLTYPFEILPDIIRMLEHQNLDFINTNRLANLSSEAMTSSHVFGNWLLSTATRVLFNWPYADSQSGMWVFKSDIWPHLDVRSTGMPFSQELKIEAFAKGFKCAEVEIEYRARAGKEKLNTISDGLGNITHLIRKRLVLKKHSALTGERIHQSITREAANV